MRVPPRHLVATATLLLTCVSSFAQPPVAEPWRHPGDTPGRVVPLDAVGPQLLTIDGDLGDWGSMGERSCVIDQTLDALATFIRHPRVSSRQRDAAALKLMYDDKALYFAIRVVDASVINPHQADQTWKGDCSEFYLDVRPVPAAGQDGVSAKAVGAPAYSDGAYQLLFIPPTQDGKPFHWWQAEQKVARIGPFDVKARVLPDGYAIEGRIPYTSLHGGITAARMRQPLGINLHVDDCDAAPGQDQFNLGGIYTIGGVARSFSSPSNYACARSDVPPVPPGKPLRYLPLRLFSQATDQTAVLGEIIPGADPAALDNIVLEARFASGPFERSFAAVGAPGAAKIVASAPSQEYPQLGVTIHRRQVHFDDVVPGRYYIDGRFRDNVARSIALQCYGMPDDDGIELIQLWDGAPPELHKMLEGGGAEIDLGEHYPATDAAVQGSVQLYAWLNFWWRLSELSEARPDVATPYQLKIEAVPLGGGKTVPVTTVTARPGRIPFTIAAGSVPIGSYDLRVSMPLPESKTKQIDWEYMPPASLEVSAPRDNVLHTTLADAPPLLRTAKLVGSPNRERFTTASAADCQARSVWDLHAFKGRVYIGCGDNERGPIDLWSLEPAGGDKAPLLRNEFTIDSNFAYQFADDGTRLAVAAMTVHEPKTVDLVDFYNLGNLYLKTAGRWEKLRTVPNAISIMEVAFQGGKLHAVAVSTTGPAYFTSSDYGKTWTSLGVGNTLQYREAFWGLAAMPDRLLIMPRYTREGAFQQQDKDLARLRLPLLPNLAATQVTAHRTQPFAGGMVYTVRDASQARQWPQTRLPGANPLYVCNDWKNGALMVEQFKDAVVTDILVREGRCYVLTSKAEDGAFEGDIFVSDDLKAWQRLAHFTVPATPNAMELVDGVFYIGLANRGSNFADNASGEIYVLRQ